MNWKTFFDIQKEQEHYKNIFKEIRKQEEKYKDVLNIFPEEKNIFRAFELCSFEQVKIVIVGQDPYHEQGQANGLAFSVNKGITIPPSLINIFKELKNEGLIKQIPNHGDLTKWALQGILLLNATLTVLEHHANKHEKLWEEFSNNLIKFISDNKEKVIFVLWGNFARNKGRYIDTHKHIILESGHPSPLSVTKFFGNNHFKKINEIYKIDWEI